MEEDDSKEASLTPDAASIDKIVKDRKAERQIIAVEKQNANLQCIREMKSDVGIDPLQRFPKEIWTYIFDGMDPQGKQNASQVHPTFHDLLENARVRDILFPLVLGLDTFHDSVNSVNMGRFNVQLRRVSKSTRQAFDLWMDEKVKKRLQETEATSNVMIYFREYTVVLSLDDKNQRSLLERMLSSFDNSGSNTARFFPRELTLSFSDICREVRSSREVRQVANSFKDNITTLLERVGDQIWHFRFRMREIKRTKFSFPDIYVMLQRWVSLMPNLKWLEILVQPSLQSISLKSYGDRAFSFARRALREHPFPHLHHLERLNLHCCSNCGPQDPKDADEYLDINEIVLGANRHIKMLDISDAIGLYDSIFPLLPSPLTQSLQLASFSVRYDDIARDDCSSNLRRIRPIVNTNWPLKTIALTVVPIDYCDNADDSLSSVFQFLENFPTLEVVKLQRLEWFKVEDMDFLKLPNLKEFELWLMEPEFNSESDIRLFFSLNFLLHCKQLTQIFWSLWKFDDEALLKCIEKQESEKPGALLDFRAGMRNLYESIIWDVFPGLESVEVDNWKNAAKDNCMHKYLRMERDRSSILLEQHKCCRNKALGNCGIFASGE